MKVRLFLFLLWFSVGVVAQDMQKATSVGGYGEAVFTDPDGAKTASMEMLRYVLYVDHQFNSKLSFNSEWEFEHSSELALEQAYLQMAVGQKAFLKAGLILVPTSVINLYHEPTFFNSVSRPLTDKTITPSTWREFGLGISGSRENGLRYQLYVVAGMNSEGFSAANSIRKGRQGAGKLEGGEEEKQYAVINNPAITGRLDYSTPVAGLDVGAAFYSGKTDNRRDGVETGSRLTVISANAAYRNGGFNVSAQWGMNMLSHADSINIANGLAANAGVGERATGFYVVTSYDVMPLLSEASDFQLSPFFMLEKINTQAKVPDGFVKNDFYNFTQYKMGVAFKPDENVVVKLDYSVKSVKAANTDDEKMLQFGLGYNF